MPLYQSRIPRKGVSSLPQSMNKTPYVNTNIPDPHCANLTPLVHLGLAHFNFARLLYRRSSLNWCFGESFEKSGGHIRLALYGFASKSKSGFGASAFMCLHCRRCIIVPQLPPDLVSTQARNLQTACTDFPRLSLPPESTSLDQTTPPPSPP